jgi:hypothetical protein
MGGQAGAVAVARVEGAGAGRLGKETTWITPIRGAYTSISNYG